LKIMNWSLMIWNFDSSSVVSQSGRNLNRRIENPNARTSEIRNMIASPIFAAVDFCLVLSESGEDFFRFLMSSSSSIYSFAEKLIA